MRARLLATTTAVLLLLGLVAGPAGAKTIPPKQWARTMCPALADFVVTFEATDAAVDAAESPADAQIALVAAIDDTAVAADDVIAAVRSVPFPDSKRGARVATAVITEFKAMKAALKRSGIAIGELDPSAAEEFIDDLDAQKQATLEVFDRSFDRIDASSDKKIDKALEANPDCEGNGGG